MSRFSSSGLYGCIWSSLVVAEDSTYNNPGSPNIDKCHFSLKFWLFIPRKIAETLYTCSNLDLRRPKQRLLYQYFSTRKHEWRFQPQTFQTFTFSMRLLKTWAPPLVHQWAIWHNHGRNQTVYIAVYPKNRATAENGQSRLEWFDWLCLAVGRSWEVFEFADSEFKTILSHCEHLGSKLQALKQAWVTPGWDLPSCWKILGYMLAGGNCIPRSSTLLWLPKDYYRTT